jgi:hypothetical protein
MKALTNSELAQSLNVKAGETKTFYFKNIVTCAGRYGGKYELQGVKITERETEKTSAVYEYQFEYNDETLTRWLEWNQVPAEIKKQAQKELGL